MVETMRWTKGRLDLLDQTLLPEKVVYRPLRTVREVTDAIRNMLVRGAPAIGVTAAFGMALAARNAVRLGPAAFHRELVKGERLLAGSRPTAVNLFWALARMRRLIAAAAARPPREIAALLEAEAVRILEEDIAINRAMGRHGAALIDDGDVVLTHCNAGALATAGFGTALGVIRAAWEAGQENIRARRRDPPALPGRQAHGVGALARPHPGDRHRGHGRRALPAQGRRAESRRRRRPHRRERGRRQQDRHLSGCGAGARQSRAVLCGRPREHVRPGRWRTGTRSRSRSATPPRSRTPAAGG